MKHTIFLPQNFTRQGVGASRVFCPRAPTPACASLLAFLAQHFPQIPTAIWMARLQDGLVLDAQGRAFTLDAAYPAAQHVYYFRHLDFEPRLPYEAQVIYQDECLVVADKPHFLPVIPSGKYLQETLLVRLKKQLNLPQLSPLHRIDRDTAGLVMFSVRPQDRAAYQALFRDGRIHKQYRAIAPYQSQLSAPLGVALHLEDAANFMQVQVNAHKAPNSFTTVTGIQRLLDDSSLARYDLRPHTGKRHQLRVHMLHLAAPIVGDQIYPDLLPERDITQTGLAPLQLLAHQLGFTDPISGVQRHFESKRRLELMPAV